MPVYRYTGLICSESAEKRRFQRLPLESRFPGSLEALDRLNGNQRIFTRRLLQDAAAHVEEARTSQAPNGVATIFIPHLCGGGGDVAIRSGNEQLPKRLTFHNLMKICGKSGRIAPYTITDGTEAFVTEKYTLKPGGQVPDALQQYIETPFPTECAGKIARCLEKIAEVEAELLASPVWVTLKELLVALPVRVENIVCFGLGDILNDPDRQKDLSVFFQYVTAYLMANFLEQLYGISSLSIPIIACDPRYTVECCQILASLPHPISVVSSPHEYLSITPHTLVFGVYLPVHVPIFEVIADALFPSGPAVMFFNNSRYEQTPRAQKMLELYDERLLPFASKQCKVWKDFTEEEKAKGIEQMKGLAPHLDEQELEESYKTLKKWDIHNLDWIWYSDMIWRVRKQ